MDEIKAEQQPETALRFCEPNKQVLFSILVHQTVSP